MSATIYVHLHDLRNLTTPLPELALGFGVIIPVLNLVEL